MTLMAISRLKKCFEQTIKEELKVALKTTLKPKVVRSIKNCKFCNKDANKIVEQAEREKAVSKNTNFLIHLATITMVIKDKMMTEEDPKTFGKAWNHQNNESQKMAWSNKEVVLGHDETAGMMEYFLKF